MSSNNTSIPKPPMRRNINKGVSEAQLYVSVVFFAFILVLAATVVAVVIQPTSTGGDQFLQMVARAQKQQDLLRESLQNVSLQLKAFRNDLAGLQAEQESSRRLEEATTSHAKDEDKEDATLVKVLSKGQLDYLLQFEKDLGNPIREKVEDWLEEHKKLLQKRKKAMISVIRGDKKEFEENELDSHKAPVHFTVLIKNMPKFSHKDVMTLLGQKCGSVTSMRSLEDQLRLTFTEVKGAQCAMDQDGKLEIDGTFLSVEAVESKGKEEANFKQAIKDPKRRKTAVKYEKVPDKEN